MFLLLAVINFFTIVFIVHCYSLCDNYYKSLVFLHSSEAENTMITKSEDRLSLVCEAMRTVKTTARI